MFHTAPSLSVLPVRYFLRGTRWLPLCLKPLMLFACQRRWGKSKEKNSLESMWTRNTLQNRGKKEKENWTVLKMYSVNYCISVKQEIPNLQFTLGICSSSCSGTDCLIKTYELKICHYTASLRQSCSMIVPSLPLSLLKQMATVCLPYLFKWLFVDLA